MKLIAWTMPGPERPEQTVAMVKLQPGDTLTETHHLSLLTDRLQEQINLAPDPDQEAKNLETRLWDLGILSGITYRSTKTAAMDLLLENPQFRDFLGLLEIILPEGPITKTDPMAEEIREEEKEMGLTLFLDSLIVP